MILLRSIRRRLVTGFTVALALMLVMAVVAIWGLLRYQTAIAELDHLIHKSPDKAKLQSAITLVMVPLGLKVDLSKDKAVAEIRNDFEERIKAAQAEADEFYRRSEDMSRGMGPRGFGGRHPLLGGSMHAVNRDLNKLLYKVAPTVSFSSETKPSHRTHMLQNVQREVCLIVAQILRSIERLPKHDYVDVSLEDQAKQSGYGLRVVRILIIAALITYAITLFCGFQWISNPLRAVARGASRIANGDTRYRLDRVTPWEDEFADLTDNFNRMADRFQESEDHLAAKVEERSRQLVRSERLADVGFLAAGVAHEINNPLQAISMAAESLQFRLHEHLDPDHEDTAEAMERLDMIQRESRRCGTITRRLLDFSRNESQEKLPNDLTRVVGEVLAMIRPMNKYSDRSIVFDHTAPLILEMNAPQIKQVILNLVANGLQATAAGGTVEVRFQEHTDWVVMEIQDDGQGMQPEHIEQLFEPFFSTKQTGEGTGLGLSITHRIIEDHHGTIDPQSQGAGQGSTFIIRLPRHQPQQVAA